MSDDDLWRWHAYAYAGRRVTMGIYDRTSPLDPDGIWFNPAMVANAERYYRQRLGCRQRSAPPQGQGARDWRRLPASDLSEAERVIAAPAVASLVARAAVGIETAAGKAREAFRGVRQEQAHGGRQQDRVPPPPPLPAEDDPRVLAMVAQMGGQVTTGDQPRARGPLCDEFGPLDAF